MTAKEIIAKLKELGSEQTKKTMIKHGAVEPIYGVKVEELKKIQKLIKVDHALSLELFDTGVSEAQYLAGLISDPAKMSKKELQHWAETALWSLISEYPVSWAVAESAYGMELALEWIDSKDEKIANTGWTALSNILAVVPNDKLPTKQIEKLVARVAKEIHKAPNRVRNSMNGFLISVGGYMPELTELAKKTGTTIGQVTVDMGDTACQVPFVPDYIAKMEKRGVIGKKRKTAKC